MYREEIREIDMEPQKMILCLAIFPPLKCARLSVPFFIFKESTNLNGEEISLDAIICIPIILSNFLYLSFLIYVSIGISKLMVNNDLIIRFNKLGLHFAVPHSNCVGLSWRWGLVCLELVYYIQIIIKSLY